MIREVITSLSNPQIKRAVSLQQKKFRLMEGKFLAEGLRSVEEALASQAVTEIFYTDADDDRARKILAAAEQHGLGCCQVAPAVMAKLSETKSPQGMLAVVKRPIWTLAQLTKIVSFSQNSSAPLVVLDRLQDPGNVGTIIRTADAAGAAGIVCLEGCVDIFSPKVVRSTMGSLFHLPICTRVEEQKFLAWCGQSKRILAVTTLADSVSIYETDLHRPLAIVIGNEANGVSDNLLGRAGLKLHIPMLGQAESLNAAVAAGVLLFESLRQRRAAGLI